MPMRIRDGRRTDGHPPRTRIDRRFSLEFATLERKPCDEGFHHGTGLKRVGKHPVTQLRTCKIGPVVGIEGRRIGQCQHLTGPDVEHHHRTGLGPVRGHRLA
ncbi:hypothetical protein SDC9_187462 [bioreactor metagenome]|uniref:Uncharacterized protein n=1 Tax=bioreactor metagenome TaxID=1076179 RepID=A0A645HLN1_9ZZZZ